MKLAVLLVLNNEEEDIRRTIDSLSGLSGTISAEDIFLIIAGRDLDEDRKNRYLERASKIGLTAFINRGDEALPALYNTFIAHANADRCTVLHSGSTVDSGYFSGIFDVLEKDSEVLIGTGRKVFKGKANNENDVFSSNDKSGIIDLDKSYGTMPWFLEGTVISSAYFAENPLDTEKGKYCETLAIMKILAGQEKLAFSASGTFICTDSRETSREYLNSCKTGTGYISFIDDMLIPLGDNIKRRDGRTPLFVQYFVLIMLQLRLDANRDRRYNNCFKDEGTASLFKKMIRSLRCVEDKVICNAYGLKIDEYGLNDIRYILGLKHAKRDYNFDMTFSRERLYAGNKDFVMFSDDRLRINILLMDYKDGKLEIDGEYPDIFSDKRIKVVAVYNGERYNLVYDKRYTSTTFFGEFAYRRKTFHVSMPVYREDESSVKFYILFKGFEYRIRNSYDSHYSRVCDTLENDYWALDDEMICCCKDGCITTLPLDKKGRKRRDRAVRKEIKHSGIKGLYLTRLMYDLTKGIFQKRKIWIFCDDIESGHGPAETMFKYAMTMHDDLYCYYLIDKDTHDSKRLKTESYRPLHSGTLSHRLILLNGGLVLTGRRDVMELNGFDLEKSAYFRGIYNFDTLMMQHESNPELPAELYNRLHDNVSLFCAASEEDAKELLQDGYCYSKEQVIVTGVPDYDYTIEDLIPEGEDADAKVSESSCRKIYDEAMKLFRKRIPSSEGE